MNPNYQLAGRGRRLGAQVLDWLIILGLPAMWFTVMGVTGQFDHKEPAPVAIVGMAIGGIWLWVAFIWNLVILSRYGQTFGKRILGIQIRRQDGGAPTFGTMVGMRVLLVGVICMIPFLGAIFALVNILFIFREDRNCIHDLLAKIMVVDLGSVRNSQVNAPSFKAPIPDRRPEPRMLVESNGLDSSRQLPFFQPSTPSRPTAPSLPVPPPLPGAHARVEPPVANQATALDQLEKLSGLKDGLKDRGILTEEEFSAEKRKLLGL